MVRSGTQLTPRLATALTVACCLAGGYPLAHAQPAAEVPGQDVAASAIDPSIEQLPRPANRFETELDIRDLLDSGDAAAAAALGPTLLALAADEFGLDDTRYADTLLLVADAQAQNEAFDAAEQNALRAVEIYRESDGTFAETLIPPYTMLGDVYRAADDYLNAIPAYEEARSISRRALGLHNPEQMAILGRLSDVAESMGEIEDAHDYQRDAMALTERRNETHSEAVVDAALQYGTWLREHNMFSREQALYSRIESAVAEEYGDDSIQQVPLLQARANGVRAQGINHPIGVSALQHAAEIVETDPSRPAVAAAVYRDIGDWQAAFNPSGSDGNAYLRSWQLLGDIDNGDALRADWYGDMPTRWVLLAARSQRGFSTAPDAATGTLVIRFTVLPTGLTTGVRISEADPAGIAEEAFLRQFRASRFRPVIRDGQIIAAERGFRVDFRYDPKRYEDN